MEDAYIPEVLHPETMQPVDEGQVGHVGGEQSIQRVAADLAVRDGRLDHA